MLVLHIINMLIILNLLTPQLDYFNADIAYDKYVNSFKFFDSVARLFANTVAQSALNNNNSILKH